MKRGIFKMFSVLVILLTILPVCYCAPNKNQGRSLVDNYTILSNDVKWFFRGISKFAGAVEQILPNVTTDVGKYRSFPEYTRVTFLMGLRHLLVGVREIAITFEQSFNTDHIKQLHQIKNVTDFLNELFTAMKTWFNHIRALVVQLLHLYNHYIPEVLLGKCLGNYLVTIYPERSYYEYPLIILTEIYKSIFTTGNSQTEPTELTTKLPIFDLDLNVEQNEISHSDFDDYKPLYDTRSIMQSAVPNTESSSTSESIFDFTTVLNANKDKIIESAVDQQSLQICLKLYTAESISRSLKIYFFGL